MLETINILLTMFNMCNVHLLAVNKVQIQIIIEETESDSEISSPSSLDKFIFETTKHRSANQRRESAVPSNVIPVQAVKQGLTLAKSA